VYEYKHRDWWKQQGARQREFLIVPFGITAGRPKKPSSYGFY
jgi:hypothetical protein